jgi:hypothetical protein
LSKFDDFRVTSMQLPEAQFTVQVEGDEQLISSPVAASHIPSFPEGAIIPASPMPEVAIHEQGNLGPRSDKGGITRKYNMVPPACETVVTKE